MSTSDLGTGLGEVQEITQGVAPVHGIVQATSGIINVHYALDTLSSASPGDVQATAIAQITLLTSYYNAVLGQAQKSFNSALGAAIVGLGFFLAAIIFLLTTQSQDIATVSVIGGAVVEVIAGINFALYGRTTTQLAYFHQRLDQTQRILLANSICEALEGETKNQTRAALVRTIAKVEVTETKDAQVEKAHDQKAE